MVKLEAGIYRLLDVHQLLVAQSKIHELTTDLLTQLYQKLEVTNQQLEHRATYDGLTGVANRHKLDQYLNACWQQHCEGTQCCR